MNEDVDIVIDCGMLWQDLYYWLNIFILILLLLWDRWDDLVLLMIYFMIEVVYFYEVKVLDLIFDDLLVLLIYEWFGNVCELCSVVECCVF